MAASMPTRNKSGGTWRRKRCLGPRAALTRSRLAYLSAAFLRLCNDQTETTTITGAGRRFRMTRMATRVSARRKVRKLGVDVRQALELPRSLVEQRLPLR